MDHALIRLYRSIFISALYIFCYSVDDVKQTKMSPGVHRDLLLVVVGLIIFAFLTATLFLMANRIKPVLVACRDNIYWSAPDRKSSQRGATDTEDRSRRQLTSPTRPHFDLHTAVKLTKNTLIRDMQFEGQTGDEIDGVKQSKETEKSKTDRKGVMYVVQPPKEEGKRQGKVEDKKDDSINTHVSEDTNPKKEISKTKLVTTPKSVTPRDNLGNPQCKMRKSREQSSLTPWVRVNPARHRNTMPDNHVSSVVKTTVFSVKVHNLQRITS